VSTSNNTFTYNKSSNTTNRRRDSYGVNKPSNRVVTSKSYIEKTKAFMHNNKGDEGIKNIQKGVCNKIQHPQNIKQNIQGGVVKDAILAEVEWSKLCTSLEY